MQRWRQRLALPPYKLVLLSLFGMFTIQSAVSVFMRFSKSTSALFPGLSTMHGSADSDGSAPSCNAGKATVDLKWYPPAQWDVNNLQSAVNGSGTYGFTFDSSQGPQDTYNWCNMPHVNPKTYPKVIDTSYKLEYVEIIHRHHKRTPYAANIFPVEGYQWNCSDEGLFYSGKRLDPYGRDSASTYWSVYTSPSNPFTPAGFRGTCQFPQITRGGLDDSHQHGVDLKAVYSSMLGFIPDEYDAETVSYRVTNNVITSQVASMIVAGMYPERANHDTPLLIQPKSIDSLEPAYSCPTASDLFNSFGPGSSSPAWQAHLRESASLFAALDAISGIDPNARDWHISWDHYFDNLSSRLCHDKPLPCSIGITSNCVTKAQAEEVFRLGEYEYSFIYRDSLDSLRASVASYGVYIAELAQNLRHAMSSTVQSKLDAASAAKIRYRHNVSHDGAIARLLSILQLDRMVWPGMGAEVVFELYTKQGCYYLRVLWGGQVMTSSHPAFGIMDMVPVETVLTYFDGLVGVDASKVPAICYGTEE